MIDGHETSMDSLELLQDQTSEQEAQHRRNLEALEDGYGEHGAGQEGQQVCGQWWWQAQQ